MILLKQALFGLCFFLLAFWSTAAAVDLTIFLAVVVGWLHNVLEISIFQAFLLAIATFACSVAGVVWLFLEKLFEEG